MTWMPDREAAARRRRRGGTQSQSHQSERGYEPGRPVEPSRSHEVYEFPGRQRSATTGRLGIPRILGRRARWVGARLRREV
ncbi:hypothetical protein [Kitasatospora camelliae]|uniref:Uncharacterized protein n=1 Tax=Kitasatospora camelliae TaxID=3156397 RepID=A0AAU8JVQ8_9ACTN